MLRMQTRVAVFAVLALLLDVRGVDAAKFNREVDIGDKAPAWKDLEGTDGKRHSLAELKKAKAVVVVFTCNHCPVAKAYEERLIEFTKTYEKRGVATVAISVSLYEADNLEAMTRRAKEKKYPFVYLYAPKQKIGAAFGAPCTPSVFLLDADRKIAYMGKFDDSMYVDRVEERFLQDAVEAVLDGKEPEITETKPIGCPIDYEEP